MIKNILSSIRFKANLQKSYNAMNIHRRSVEEIFKERTETQDLYLKADREELGIQSSELKIKLDTLKWVLGEI